MQIVSTKDGKSLDLLIPMFLENPDADLLATFSKGIARET